MLLFMRFQDDMGTGNFHVSANFISVMLTNFLPGVEFNLTVGLLALVSVVTLAILFVILFVIDNKVKRTKI